MTGKKVTLFLMIVVALAPWKGVAISLAEVTIHRVKKLLGVRAIDQLSPDHHVFPGAQLSGEHHR